MSLFQIILLNVIVSEYSIKCHYCNCNQIKLMSKIYTKGSTFLVLCGLSKATKSVVNRPITT